MQDKSICKEVLEILLPFQVEDLEYVEYQKTIDIFNKTKSVRLDVYVKGRDKVYNVEMQIGKDVNLAKRARFYQAAIDFDMLEKGHKYKELQESFVIFICTFDPFDRGLPCYSFKNKCQEETGLCLEDGRQIIFFHVNAYLKDNNRQRRNFLAFIAGNKIDDPIIHKFESRIERLKNNNALESEYMNLALKFQDAIDEGEQRGWLKGEKVGRLEGEKAGRLAGAKSAKVEVAKNLFDILDDALIAEKTGLSLDEVQLLKIKSQRNGLEL